MLHVNLKQLLERLGPLCMDKFQAASGLCVSMTHYEVCLEHILAKLVDAPESDFRHIIEAFGVDRIRLARELNQVLAEFPKGCAGRPTLSPLLVELLQQALLVAVVELNENHIRSGTILLAMLAPESTTPAVEYLNTLRT